MRGPAAAGAREPVHHLVGPIGNGRGPLGEEPRQILPAPREDYAAYTAGWPSVPRDDKRAVPITAGHAL